MDKNAILKDANVIESMLTAPKIYLEQFVKLSAYYQAYINIDKPSVQDRTDFINECYNATTMLNKLIAAVSNGERLEDQVKAPSEFGKENIDNAFNHLQKYIEDTANSDVEEMNADEVLGTKKKKNNKPIKIDFMDASDLFYEELENWGIHESLSAHDCMVAMGQCCTNNDTPKEAIRKIADYLNKPVATVASSFAYITRNANFRKSKYSEVLRTLDYVPTKELLIEEYLTYC